MCFEHPGEAEILDFDSFWTS